VKLILIIILLSGCAVKPYAELSAGYTLHQTPDYWLTVDGKVAPICQIPVNIGIGVEHKTGFFAELTHRSNADCSYPELTNDSVTVGYKIGGYK